MNEQLQMTNRPWQLDAAAISRQFGIARVRLMNDFTAQAYALPHLASHQLCTLQAGKAQENRRRALIGAGTGLGMALLASSEGQPLALASQGGHADFAPRDQQQIDLLHFLLPTCRRVSLEMLLSGQGLTRLYAFISQRAPGDPDLPDAHAISLAADAGEIPAIEALQLFARLYAAAAGNLALTSLPFGGLYLSGGIAPKMLAYLQHGEFRAAFCDIPPMQAVLESIPVHVVLDEFLGLHGAMQVAAQLQLTEDKPA
jgi:glucokinase